MKLSEAISNATSQLAKVIGNQKAVEELSAGLRVARVTEVRTAQELLQLADALGKRGGFVEIIGRSLKIHALLLGAQVATTAVATTLQSRPS